MPTDSDYVIFFGVLLALPASAILSIALRELRRSYLASALYKN